MSTPTVPELYREVAAMIRALRRGDKEAVLALMSRNPKVLAVQLNVALDMLAGAMSEMEDPEAWLSEVLADVAEEEP